MDSMVALWIGVGVSALILISRQFLGRFIYRYQITESDLRVTWLGLIPVKRVKFVNIAEVTVVSQGEKFSQWDPKMFFTYRGENRVTGHCVLVRQKRWFLHRQVALTPDDPEGFALEIQRHIIFEDSKA